MKSRSPRNKTNSPPSNMERRWLSVEEIARYLGVVQESVYRWTRNKGLPAHRVGKLWKFKADEVDRWIKSGKANESITKVTRKNG